MKKLILLLCLTLVSCFIEPKKENQTVNIINKSNNSEPIIADTTAIPKIEESLNKVYASDITLEDLENLAILDKSDFENFVTSKGYKINDSLKDEILYEKSDDEYIVLYSREINKRPRFLFYTTDVNLFNKINKECQKRYDLLGTVENEVAPNTFFTNENYKIMFAKFDVGNYCISVYINEDI